MKKPVFKRAVLALMIATMSFSVVGCGAQVKKENVETKASKNADEKKVKKKDAKEVKAPEEKKEEKKNHQQYIMSLKIYLIKM